MVPELIPQPQTTTNTLTLCKVDNGIQCLWNVHTDHQIPGYATDVTNATVRQSTANERYVERQVSLYVLRVPSHFPTEYRHETAMVSREHRMKWVVILGDGYQWPLPWECSSSSANLNALLGYSRWIFHCQIHKESLWDNINSFRGEFKGILNNF